MNMQFVNSHGPIRKNNPLPIGSIIYNQKNTTRSLTQERQIPSTPPPDSSKKPKWGQPTWFLFHTLADKLKVEYSEIVLPELYKMIVMICSNLPCPTCTKHATEYLSKVKPYTIRSKEDLKKMLFQFHNEVNTRKGYPLFEYSELDAKYPLANTKNIVYHFLHFFKTKDFNISMITNNMHREQTISIFRNWISKNIDAFDL